MKSLCSHYNPSDHYLKDCAAVILYTAEAATQMALDAIQILGASSNTAHLLLYLKKYMYDSFSQFIVIARFRWKWLHQ